MAEYIERERVLSSLGGYMYADKNDKWAVRCLVEIIPAADVVEVVRCKDCKHRGKDAWCAYVDENDSFFCGRGERRDDHAAD